MTCDHCGHVWIAVSPAAATQLECPICHKMSEVWPVDVLVGVRAGDLNLLLAVVSRALHEYRAANPGSDRRQAAGYILGLKYNRDRLRKLLDGDTIITL